MGREIGSDEKLQSSLQNIFLTDLYVRFVGHVRTISMIIIYSVHPVRERWQITGMKV